MKKITLIILAFLLSISSVFAQLSTSTLLGTISGPDGVLPGAMVVVKDNKTAKEITVKTDNDGGFKVPNLEIGFYTVTVTAQGFKTFTAEQVKLEVGKDYSLTPQLQIGDVTESVTVVAGADPINSTDAKINGSVSNVQLTQLPLLTRNPLGFVQLQAGIASNPSQNSTINGVRTSATNISIEGVNVQDNFIRSNATDFSPQRPIVDEVEEFTISSQANVEDGFGAGNIQLPIRRGGNVYTGSLWEYNRNSSLGANSFFNNLNRIARGFRNRNEFGGRFQGPLPFFNFGEGGPEFTNGKDKLFFFVLYQKTIDKQPVSKLNTVLSPNARNGIFTYTANTNDPANGVIAGQVVSVNLLNLGVGGITAINPTTLSRFIAPLPSSNSTETGDLRNTFGYRFNQNGNASQENYTTRIDYKINNTNSIRGIFRYAHQTVQRTDADNSFFVNPTVDQPSDNPLFSFGYTANITPNFSNELNGGYTSSNPTFLRNDTLPKTYVVPTLVSSNENTFQNQGRTTKAYNLQDNATYIFGNHSIRFGGQFQRNEIASFDNFNTVPTFNLGVGTNTPQISTTQFTNTSLFPGQVPTAQRATANALLALYGGIIGSANQSFNVTSQSSGFVPGASNSRRYRNSQYAAYVSDQWRVRPDLTFTAGVRYDYYTPVNSVDRLFLEPAIANGTDPRAAILNPNGRYQFVGGNAGKPGDFYKADKNNFAPNFSLAYSPRATGGITGALLGEGKTVFRGGYRISYINDETIKSASNAGTGNAGLNQGVNLLNPATGTTSLNLRIGDIPTTVIPTPIFNGNRTFADNNTAAFSFFGTVYAIDPNIKSPRVQEFSVGVQREIGFKSVLEVRYVGTRSKDLLRAVDFNQIDIRGNGFLADFNRARANLLACQAQLGNGCTTGGGFNAAVTGSQQLTVFPNLASGGLLTNSTITGQLVAGTPADLALVYIQNGLTGNVGFLPNPGIGVVDFLGNSGRSRYDSLQVELRRRFADGLLMQANYTFSKNLTNSQGAQTNATGDTQNRFDPLLDNLNPGLENSRALADQTHRFNFNAVYSLPFGKGGRYFSNSRLADTLLGGIQFSGVVQIGSGAPISFVDPRGTLNRAGRSNRQSAVTSLTKQQLKDLVGIYKTPNGIFFLPPAVLGRNADGSLNTAVGGTGRGANGFGSTAFQGQIFFNNAPGQTSNLERNIVNGPTYYTVDLSAAKRFNFGERYSFQVQIDAFNALNRTNFVVGQSQNINSTTFGQINTAFAPRVVQLSGRFNF